MLNKVTVHEVVSFAWRLAPNVDISAGVNIE